MAAEKNYAEGVGQDHPDKEPVTTYDREHGQYKNDSTAAPLGPAKANLPAEPSPFTVKK